VKDLLHFALSYYGLEEEYGTIKNNPKIIEFFSYTGHRWVITDETGWCSAFINYLAKRLGYQYSGRLDARSWLNVGFEVLNPRLGDLAILWREDPNGWKGHIGFYIRETATHVYVLGGNQSNQVMISKYPKSQLLEYRIITKDGLTANDPRVKRELLIRKYAA